MIPVADDHDEAKQDGAQSAPVNPIDSDGADGRDVIVKDRLSEVEAMETPARGLRDQR
jgi:hypothetical protein